MKYFILFFIASINTYLVYAQDTIIWNKNKKLTFNDYKGQTEKNSKFGAVTDIGISILFSGSTESITIKARTISINSWMIDKKNTNLLNHEQRHFDISEIWARKLRKIYEIHFFSNYKYAIEIDSIYTKYMLKYDLMQELYDNETNFSRNKECQEEWNKYIDQMLKELEEYSNPIVKLRFKEDEE